MLSKIKDLMSDTFGKIISLASNTPLLDNFLLSIDQLVNVFMYSRSDKLKYGYGFGKADETISARCYRLRMTSTFWGWMFSFVNKLFFWQEGHCETAYLHEVERRQMPSVYNK